MNLNPEKQEIIKQDGNVLVTANPGTGKTRLLAYKYVDLIKKGIGPENILCLTFTDKAKREMEGRILDAIKDEKVKVDVSKLNVFTFHSYALDNIEENEIITSNLLRFAIFQYLKDNEILNYNDDYLLEVIVPKMENLLRYLKSFGITPDKIDIKEAKKHLEAGKNYTKEEIDKFAEDFLLIFRHYEAIKTTRGVDYADLLIKFLELKDPPQFEYVLVDELQDVNTMEADIALKSGKQFIAVGDKKQAIFGFQGGSILNFKKFENSKECVLSENFRSTNEILYYAREYFTSKTKEESHKEELKDLHNAEDKSGPKPIIYDVGRKDAYAVACELIKKFSGKTAVIARTNYQIADISREMKARGMDFSSTFFSASNDAKNYIILFLRGILSNNVQDVKNAMFTPFFPCSLQEAFNLAEKRDLKLEEIYDKVPEFKSLKDSVKTVEDVNTLFREKIIPICISYGKEYLSAAITLQNSYQEALKVLEQKSMHFLTAYLQSTDLLSQESDVEKELVLTTVHKAKGKEFDNVIYIPARTSNRENFQDKIVEAILESKGINAEEELEEETLRVNFVAFARAEKNLIILTDKIQDYLSEYAELKDIEASEKAGLDLNESKRRAFDLFVNGQFEKAKELLSSKDKWIKDFVKKHFEALDHTSFSSLPENAYDYFVDQILNIRKISPAMTMGLEVHRAAESIIAGEEPTVSEEVEPFVDNLKQSIEKIKEEYPEVCESEMKIDIPLSTLGFESKLRFFGIIDAVFKNKEKYLIVDWKTDKRGDYSSKYRQQLSAYKKAFSAKKEIPPDKIKVAICYVGLRNTINTGKVMCELDARQPVASAFKTLSKRINKLLSWINNVDLFFQEFIDQDKDDMLWRSVVEEYKKENNNQKS